MKKVLLIALILTFTVGSAVAQQQGGPGNQGGGQGKAGLSQIGGNSGDPVERLTELLGLDETQADAIALIFEDSQLLREEERERARAAAEEQRAITHNLIMDVLTTDQQAIFEEHRQQREALKEALEDMGYGRGFGGGGRGSRNCDG